MIIRSEQVEIVDIQVESASSCLFLLIAVLLWFSVFIAPLSDSYIEAVDKQMVSSIRQDLKSHTSPQLIIFELPSKQKVKENKDPVIDELIAQLVVEANSYLSEKSPSVIDKNRTVPNGDRHDYFSMAPYYWPDNTKSDGVPYIYRDGDFNPEVLTSSDGISMHRMIERVKILSITYYYTGDTIYANKTSELLRAWFLNNDTFMNPHIEHGEVITGKNNGTRSGIITARNFPVLLDAIRLIEGSPSWTEEDQKGIELWFDRYLYWLLNSDFGKREGKALNNHGTWYDVQASSIALFLNKKEITSDILQQNINKLISKEIQPEGSQTYELGRSNSLNYHIFNLLGFFKLAKIGDNIGIDLWNYKTSDGAGLQTAVDYILPFALNKEKWPYEQIKPIDNIKLHDLLCQATVRYHSAESFKQFLSSLNLLNVTREIDDLIYGCNSLLTD